MLIGEDFADGLVSKRALAEAKDEIGRMATPSTRCAHLARIAARHALFRRSRVAAFGAAGYAAEFFGYRVLRSKSTNWEVPDRKEGAYLRAVGRERKIQAGLFRDLVGNPFRPVILDPLWLSSAVRNLARGIYEERAFDQLLILADALEEAGCPNEDLLSHCRQPGEHIRGCWALDVVLGKE
jgi:hypothetical protein